MNLFRHLNTSGQQRSAPLSLDEWASYFTFNGANYPFLMTGGGPAPADGGEQVDANFRGYIDGIYKRNGVVFACMAARQLLFSEARFQFRRLRDGRPGDLFGTQALQILEQPWPKATTGDLLTRAILDIDLAGNFYAVRRGNKIRRLRPDWVTIILGSETDNPIDVEIAGYQYREGGTGDPQRLLPETVCHFAPLPDPAARFRGMSWLSPIIGDILGDQAATEHKTGFLRNGAALGYVVTLDPDGKMQPDAFERWIDTFNASHDSSPEKAYKTLFLAGGADVKTVGTDLRQLDFKAVQGAGETRICAAARVPPIIAGFSEGLASATYCLPADERVWTLDGPRAVAGLRAGDEVWSSGGDPPRPARVSWQGCVGEKLVYEIRTKNRVLRATDMHPVLVRVAGHSRGHNSTRAPRVEWRRVDELRPGDQVVQANSLPDADGMQPEWASPELVQWLGAYMGDGSGAGRGGISLAIPPTDRTRATYEALTADLFDVRIGYEPRSFRFHAKGISQLVATLGFAGTAKTKRIPGWVFRLPRNQRLRFLAGLIDTDGYVDKRGVGALGFANRELVEQARALFVSCGVQVSNVAYRKQMALGLPNPGLRESYDFWSFAVTTGLGDVPVTDPLYLERLRNRCDAREGGDAWKADLDPDRLGFFTVRSVTPGVVEPVYDISVEGEHSFFAGGVAVHNSNYGQARRAFADLTMRPLWRNMAGSLASIIDVPPDTLLWYDDRDIPFLQEDLKDEAEIKSSQATTIATLVREGFTSESAVLAVTSGDMSLLEHTGLFSVQLQAPGTITSPSSNGNDPAALPI